MSQPERPDGEALGGLIDLWGGDRDFVEELDGRHARIYGFASSGRRLVLRLLSASRRRRSEVEAELDWMRHLERGGAPITAPVASTRGTWVEEIEVPAGDRCFATVFARAPGRSVNIYGADEFNADLFREWGRAAGRIHALSKSFRPRPGRTRPRFNGPAFVEFVTAGMAASDPRAVESAQTLWRRLSTLPRDRDSYGLIHGDLATGNFLVDKGEITVFDFDCSFYGWFAYDLAITVYITLFGLALKRRPLAEAESFFTELMVGYRRENRLSEGWFAKLWDLIAFFNITLYAAHSNQQWENSDLLSYATSILEDGGPYAALDFERLYRRAGLGSSETLTPRASLP